MPYRVYVVRLQNRVREKTAFQEANPRYRDGKPCVYVGMTGRTREERFRQHQEGYKSSPWVRRFGRRLFPWAWEGTGEYRTSSEAAEAEVELAERLRARGWGVWQN
jgi:predicted GIY-YIG superfamily endonuclease